MSIRKSVLGLIAFAILSLAACGNGVEAPDLEPPATKVAIDGTDRYRVTLTAEAAARIDIRLAEVTETDFGLQAPSAALILDKTGQFWVYVESAPLTYERVAIGPVREDDGEAFFTEGPAPGTPVVVAGVPELYGEETGVGK